MDKVHAYMSIEHFNNMLRLRAITDLGARNPFSYIPISSPERCRSPVQGISEHGALFDGPFREDGQTTAQGTTVIELAVGKDEARLIPDAPVVVLVETLL